MTGIVSTKIYKIFDRLVNSPYKGTIRCHHFAIAIRGGKQITPLSYNYYRTHVFGKVHGTIHAEMSSISHVLNTFGNYNNHKPTHQYILRPKVAETS
jgi:hypothetical protein